MSFFANFMVNVFRNEQPNILGQQCSLLKTRFKYKTLRHHCDWTKPFWVANKTTFFWTWAVFANRAMMSVLSMHFHCAVVPKRKKQGTNRYFSNLAACNNSVFVCIATKRTEIGIHTLCAWVATNRSTRPCTLMADGRCFTEQFKRQWILFSCVDTFCSTTLWQKMG